METTKNHESQKESQMSKQVPWVYERYPILRVKETQLEATGKGRNARGLALSKPFACKTGASRAKGQADSSAPFDSGMAAPVILHKKATAKTEVVTRRIGLWAQDEVPASAKVKA
jgi:hypothetical protein